MIKKKIIGLALLAWANVAGAWTVSTNEFSSFSMFTTNTALFGSSWVPSFVSWSDRRYAIAGHYFGIPENSQTLWLSRARAIVRCQTPNGSPVNVSDATVYLFIFRDDIFRSSLAERMDCFFSRNQGGCGWETFIAIDGTALQPLGGNLYALDVALNEQVHQLSRGEMRFALAVDSNRAPGDPRYFEAEVPRIMTTPSVTSLPPSYYEASYPSLIQVSSFGNPWTLADERRVTCCGSPTPLGGRYTAYELRVDVYAQRRPSLSTYREGTNYFLTWTYGTHSSWLYGQNEPGTNLVVGTPIPANVHKIQIDPQGIVAKQFNPNYQPLPQAFYVIGPPGLAPRVGQ